MKLQLSWKRGINGVEQVRVIDSPRARSNEALVLDNSALGSQNKPARVRARSHVFIDSLIADETAAIPETQRVIENLGDRVVSVDFAAAMKAESGLAEFAQNDLPFAASLTPKSILAEIADGHGYRRAIMHAMGLYPATNRNTSIFESRAPYRFIESFRSRVNPNARATKIERRYMPSLIALVEVYKLMKKEYQNYLQVHLNEAEQHRQGFMHKFYHSKKVTGGKRVYGTTLRHVFNKVLEDYFVNMIYEGLREMRSDRLAIDQMRRYSDFISGPPSEADRHIAALAARPAYLGALTRALGDPKKQIVIATRDSDVEAMVGLANYFKVKVDRVAI